MPKILDEWLGYCNMKEVLKNGTTKLHNKWWAGCILEDDDGSFRIHTLYAALGQRGSEHIERYNKQGKSLTRGETRLLFDNLVREKRSPRKGYEQKAFDVPFGTPKQVTVPSFVHRFSSPFPSASLAPSFSASPTQATHVAPSAPKSSSMVLTCAHCGTQTPLQDEFCRNCGMALISLSGQTPQASPTHSSSIASTMVVSLVGPLPDGYRLNQDRYTIEKKVGQGGMGAVYKARDHKFADRIIAIKELVPDPRLDSAQLDEAKAGFEQEALLLASLSHQSLPRIYDHFIDASGRSYLVMDFIEGETLEKRLERPADHRLPIEQVLSIGIALCDVLDYLHTQRPPIIFRDLKPANIMITHRDHVYLIDFGIARAYKFGQSRDTVALGSPGYAAPEQYGKSQSLPKTDIYGLGATLHQMATGSDPSEHPFFFARLPSDLQKAVPGLQDLLLGMVATDLKLRRPANAAKVEAELLKMQSFLNRANAHQSLAVPVKKKAGKLSAKKQSLYLCLEEGLLAPSEQEKQQVLLSMMRLFHYPTAGLQQGTWTSSPKSSDALEMLLRDALITQGVGHKQWYLEQIMKQEGLQITMPYTPGIEP